MEQERENLAKAYVEMWRRYQTLARTTFDDTVRIKALEDQLKRLTKGT